MKLLTLNHKALAALLALSLAGCGGGGGGGSFVIGDSGDDSADDSGDDSGTTTATYQISGTISATTGTTVDSDINDIYATYASNDDPAEPQALSNIATVQGFASAAATNARLSSAASTERYASSFDKRDYFSATLQKDQIVQLQVVNYAISANQYRGDLDLYLLNPDDGSTVLASDSASAQYETITVPADGTYLIEVRAYSGISRYVLQLLASSASSSAPAALMDDFVPNQVIMQSSTTVSTAAAAAGVSIASSKTSQGGPTLMTLSRTSAAAKSGTSSDDPLRAYNETLWEKMQTLIDIKTLKAQDGVEFAEPNYIRKPLSTTPTDPKYSLQWHYRNIDLPAAWDLSKGDDVIVAVVDTGVYLAHEDLADNLIDGYDFISDTSISLDGDGIDDNPDDPGDQSSSGQSSWHGTHVSGTVAAVQGNSLGGVGVAWNAKVMPIRVLGYGGGTSYDIIQGVRYAAGLSNDSGTLPAQAAGVINLSLGGSSYSAAEQAVYTAAINNGAIIVAAAGNSASSSAFYPAAYDGVISVSATDYNDELSYYSNYGSTIDVAAPGGDASSDKNGDFRADGIYSTYVDNSTGTRQSSYTYNMQGTSMASPHVAGVVALMKSVYPQLTSNNVNALIQSCAITSKATDDTCARDNEYGYGLIDAYLAVTEALKLANGDSSITLPVSLQTSPSSLLFGSVTSSLSFVLSNGGDDAADVTGVSDDADWLSVSATSVDSSGLGTYTASVDRSALDDGSYTATITLTDASSSTATVSVYLQVGSVSTADDMTVQYVVIEQTGCDSDCYSTSVMAGSDGSYSISDVPEGSYYVVAGSDIDVDLYICDDGETCGAYPTTGAMQAVELTADTSGVDFLVTLVSGSGSSTASVARSSDNSTSKAIAR